MIFKKHAPAFWAAGLPVIPLQGKRPLPFGWHRFADQMPDESLRKRWLERNPDANIGLPLGPQSGLVALDIDSEDPRLMKVLMEYLPPSPWKRYGRKGCVMVYRYNGERTFRIKTRKEQMLCELLSKGAQVVLPPSIHPDTERPYTENVPLLDVISIVPSLPEGIETTLREALQREGFDISISGWSKISTFVPAGARDNSMVAHAGILARAVTRGERTLLEALNEIQHWCENFTEKVVGDDIDPDKAKQKVIEFVTRDVLGEKRRTLPVGWDDGLTEEDKKKLGLDVVTDRVQWSVDQIRSYLTAEFSKYDPGSPGMLHAIEVALGRMVTNEAISTLEKEGLLRWMSESSGRVATISALKKRLAELEKGEITGADHTEIAKAVLKELREYGEICYHNSRFWQWKGACWQPMNEWEIIRYIAEEYGHLPSARRANDHRGIVHTMKALAMGELKRVDISGINFANGILLEDMTLKPHAPEYGMTYVLPYRYVPEVAGKCPKFFQLLQDAWGDMDCYEEQVMALQEAIAATMFGVAPVFQRAICLYGVPHSGKSQVMDVVAELMPEEARSLCSPINWSDKFAPATMAGKLINLCGELPDDGIIEGSMFKMVIDGQEIQGQFKGKDIFHFRPVCAHWFSTNHLPRTKDSSDGFTRRWMFLEFPKRVPSEQKILRLAYNIISEEREAIAAWAVKGLERLKKNRGYTLSSAHKRLEEEVANQNNSVRFFLTHSQNVKRDVNGFVDEFSLHNAYWSFCVSVGGSKPVGIRNFRQRMKELQDVLNFRMTTKKMGPYGAEVMVYEGIKLES